MSNLDDLKAMIEEKEKIKGIVLQLLHWQKGRPFDPTGNVLNPEIENLIGAQPEDIERN